MKSLLMSIGIAGGIGVFLTLLFYCLPVGISFTLAVAAEVLVLGVFLWMAAKLEHYWQIYVGIGVLLLLMVGVGWAQGWERLKGAAIHAQVMFLNWQSSPSRLSLRLAFRLLISSLLVAATLMLVLWEYLSLVSS